MVLAKMESLLSPGHLLLVATVVVVVYGLRRLFGAYDREQRGQ